VRQVLVKQNAHWSTRCRAPFCPARITPAAIVGATRNIGTVVRLTLALPRLELDGDVVKEITVPLSDLISMFGQPDKTCGDGRPLLVRESIQSVHDVPDLPLECGVVPFIVAPKELVT